MKYQCRTAMAKPSENALNYIRQEKSSPNHTQLRSALASAARISIHSTMDHQQQQPAQESAALQASAPVFESIAYDDWGLSENPQHSIAPVNTPEQPDDLQDSVRSPCPTLKLANWQPSPPDSDGGSSWERERQLYEQGLRTRTALLSSKLTEQIQNEQWSSAVSTRS
ncbi:hypothetical protein GHT06_011571 [Daphnia sinensis]|uniref:Uncharacterized protein n=1 Tax=Daphnia sinensis TaxID=1820382 RepID=A0AAD5KU46_9CRUS|nr:hypothetical protein GHT06_011571 [Daphnia sinensis]